MTEASRGWVSTWGATAGTDGVTGADACEVAEAPSALKALTVKVYACPLMRSGTVSESRPSVPGANGGRRSSAVSWPTTVTVYWVMLVPPSETGGSQDTVAEPSPATACTLVGAPGTVVPAATLPTETLTLASA